MAKCFITGIELPIEDAYVLDITAARHALQGLRMRVGSLERLVNQLGEYDRVEVFSRKKKKKILRRDRRLVSPSIATALSSACPERRLFISWSEWLQRRKQPVAALIVQLSTMSSSGSVESADTKKIA